MASPAAASRIGAAGLSLRSRAIRASRLAAPSSGIEQIGLGQHDAIGDRGLLHRLGVIVERVGPVHRIDQRHHAVEPKAHHQIRMLHQGLQQRRGIGEPGGLHDHALERGAAVVEIAQQLFERGDEIAAQIAAQASARQHHHVAVDLFDQQMVERDLAELVDQDRGVAQIGIAQQGVEQRGLAGAEKAREQRQRDRRRRSAGLVGRGHRAAGCAGFCAGGLAVASAVGSGFFFAALLGRRLLADAGSGTLAAPEQRSFEPGFAAGVRRAAAA